MIRRGLQSPAVGLLQKYEANLLRPFGGVHSSVGEGSYRCDVQFCPSPTALNFDSAGFKAVHDLEWAIESRALLPLGSVVITQLHERGTYLFLSRPASVPGGF